MPAMAYSMNIRLNQEERMTLRRLDVLVTVALAISNDLISWPKEKLETKITGREPCSCVTIMMKGLAEERAIFACRAKFFMYEAKVAALCADLIDDPSTTINMRRMICAYPLLISGSAAWQCISPRYHCDGSTMETVKQAIGSEVCPTKEDEESFEQESEQIVEACLILYQRYLG